MTDAPRRGSTTNLKIPAPVVNWLKATYVEDIHGALKKAEMYAEYEAFCKESRMKPKDPNTFGKYVLRIFPTAYPSRLGSILDGSQAHCYSGISRAQRRQEIPAPVDVKVQVPVPVSLPVPMSCAMPTQLQPLAMPMQPVKEETHSVFSTIFRCAPETSYMDCSPVADSELEAMVDAMLAEAETLPGGIQQFFCPSQPFFDPLAPQPQPQQQIPFAVPTHCAQPASTQPAFFAPSPVPIVWWETEEPSFSCPSTQYSEALKEECAGDSFDFDFTTTAAYGNHCSYC